MSQFTSMDQSKNLSHCGSTLLPESMHNSEALSARHKSPGSMRPNISLPKHEPEYYDSLSLNTSMTFSGLPTDIHHCIVDFLNTIDSACLGLTNHPFYAVHKKRHRPISLSARQGRRSADPCHKCPAACELRLHLDGWMPRDMEYCSISEKYGRPAATFSQSYCSKRCPKNSSLCGRHHLRT